MTRIYWYAPFNNTGELETATELAKLDPVDITVESLAERFGVQLPANDLGRLTLIRDLPAPSGEGARRRSVLDRGRVAIERSIRRHRLVQKSGFDLVHLHTFNPITDWIALSLLKRHTGLLIQSVHNVRPHDSMFPPRVETVLFGRGYRTCDAIFVAHPLLKEMLVDEMNVKPERIHIVPFALTMPVFAERPMNEPEVRPVTFLFFGTFRHNKGIDVLLAALARLDERASTAGVDYRVVFAGRGEPALEQKVVEFADGDRRVTAEIGYVTNERRPELYREADCVLLPYTELRAQSGVLHDAYASRLPVIASDVLALGDAVRTDGTGWVVEPGDVDQLADAMFAAATDPERRVSAGDRAGACAEGHSTGAVAELLAELYGRLLGDGDLIHAAGG